MIIVSVLTINYAIAQTTDWFELDTVKLYDTNGNIGIQHVYTYNSSGYLEFYLVQKWNTNASQLETLYWYSYMYDDRGNKLTEFYYLVGSSDTSKEFWTYDNNNNMLTYIIQATYYTNRITYQYDAKNNCSSVLTQNWKNNDWENTSKSMYQYDAKNNCSSVLTQSWKNNDWENTSLGEYEYDGNNNQTKSVASRWTSGSWNPSNRILLIYNANDKLIETTTQLWNNEWKNISNFTRIYDKNGNKLEETNYTWKDTNWEAINIYTYTYDSNNNILTEILEKYNTYDGMWYKNYRHIYTYDEYNNELTYISQGWYGEWRDDILYTWEYDEHSNAASGFVQQWKYNVGWTNYYTNSFTVLYNNMQSNVSAGGMQAHKFEASYKKIEKVGIASAVLNNQLRVYPNPTRGQLTIENLDMRYPTSDIRLFDIVGKEIFVGQSDIGNRTTLLDISHLSSGLYFLKIDNKTVKLIKN